MTREQAIRELKIRFLGEYDRQREAKDMAIKALEKEPREITLEDVKEYCKPRCLTIITNELLYELTHPKIKALEQESKPMVEIDLYSVIKQKYIEREVLDKIRAEIEQTRKMYLEMNDIDWLNGCDYVLSVIDKYKGEARE